MRLMAGLLRASAGALLVGGLNPLSAGNKLRTMLGYMPQKFGLYEELTVQENLDFFAGIYGLAGPEATERREEVLALGGLAASRNVPAHDLPGGLRQRLALASAIIHRPSVLFLDEPTAGVDPISRREFWELIRQMASAGTAVLVTTHYMDEAEYCHTLALIYQGRLIAKGAPSLLKTGLHGNLVEVEVDPADLAPALRALQGNPAAHEVAMFGASLHMTLDSTEALPALQTFLRQEGIVPRRMEPILPSLEDVFVSLVAREGQP
jgi:ABC-2 type transport system ATP-binding protein